MKIKKINDQIRRDFWADLECEHCGHIEKNRPGYDDANYHQNVIPDIPCQECGKKSPKDYRPLGTKYPEGQVV